MCDAHCWCADLVLREEEGDELQPGLRQAQDSNVGLLPLVLAQTTDHRSTASGSVLAGQLARAAGLGVAAAA